MLRSPSNRRSYSTARPLQSFVQLPVTLLSVLPPPNLRVSRGVVAIRSPCRSLCCLRHECVFPPHCSYCGVSSADKIDVTRMTDFYHKNSSLRNCGDAQEVLLDSRRLEFPSTSRRLHLRCRYIGQPLGSSRFRLMRSAPILADASIIILRDAFSLLLTKFGSLPLSAVCLD